MTATTTTRPVTARSFPRTGWVITGLVSAFLLFDGVIHLTRITPVVQSFQDLGFPISAAAGIGVVELVCLALYLVPRTAVLGAVLLTGYLGGAVAAQVRVEAPLLSTLLFPVYTGIALWAGLYLRDAAVRALLPLRRS
jgi:hypothetical protein